MSLAARAGHLTTLKLLLDEEVNRACRAQFPDWPVTTTIRDIGSNAAADESMTTAASVFSVLTSEQTKFVEDAKKAIVNQTDGNGCTPLITAAGQYHREVVTYLLQEGSIPLGGEIHQHLPCIFLIIFITAFNYVFYFHHQVRVYPLYRSNHIYYRTSSTLYSISTTRCGSIPS